MPDEQRIGRLVIAGGELVQQGIGSVGERGIVSCSGVHVLVRQKPAQGYWVQCSSFKVFRSTIFASPCAVVPGQATRAQLDTFLSAGASRSSLLERQKSHHRVAENQAQKNALN